MNIFKKESIPDYLEKEIDKYCDSDLNWRYRLKAFKKVLESDYILALDCAFSRFNYVQPSTRFGLENPWGRFSDLLLTKAKAVLKRYPADLDIISYLESMRTLGFLHVGDEEELYTTQTIFDTSNDDDLIFFGCWVLQSCLRNNQKFYPELLRIFKEIIFEGKLNDWSNRSLLQTLGEYRITAAEEILIKVVKECSVELSIDAASTLKYRDLEKHSDLLRSAYNSWPDEDLSPYHLREKREIIEALENPDRSEAE